MKKTDELNNALNEIGDDLIRDAEDNVPALIGKKKHSWVKWVGIAAAVVVAAVAIPIGVNSIVRPKNNAASGVDAAGTTVAAAIDEGMAAPGGATFAEGDIVFTGEERTGFSAAEIGKYYSKDGKGDTGYFDTSGGKGTYGGTTPGEVEAPGDSREDPDTNAEPGTELTDETKTEPETDTETEPETETETEPETDTETEPEPEPPVPEPGQLTAAAWDDNAHYLKWKELFLKNEQNETSGKFSGTYYGESGEQTFASWGLDSLNRIEVTVTFAGMPLFDALVTLTTASGERYSARTNRNGIAYVFGGNAGTLTVTSPESSEVHTVPVNGEKEVAVTFEALDDMEETVDVIELMYVVDVTGSMGDELRYLREELGDVIKQVVRANPDSRVKLALLFYRDDGDEEKFRYVEFKDVTDPADYESHYTVLTKQEAAGGGDTPEALDEALEMAVSKGWTTGSTKILFHVFDAPAHGNSEHQSRLKSAIASAAEQGVRICPIMASGADELTEYTARSEAILTGGTFIFMTDDSGIGYSHFDPQLPDAVHEYLNLLMIRLINGYHTGTFAEPVPWNEAK